MESLRKENSKFVRYKPLRPSCKCKDLILIMIHDETDGPRTNGETPFTAPSLTKRAKILILHPISDKLPIIQPPQNK